MDWRLGMWFSAPGSDNGLNAKKSHKNNCKRKCLWGFCKIIKTCPETSEVTDWGGYEEEKTPMTKTGNLDIFIENSWCSNLQIDSIR